MAARADSAVRPTRAARESPLNRESVAVSRPDHSGETANFTVAVWLRLALNDVHSAYPGPRGLSTLSTPSRPRNPKKSFCPTRSTVILSDQTAPSTSGGPFGTPVMGADPK